MRRRARGRRRSTGIGAILWLFFMPWMGVWLLARSGHRAAAWYLGVVWGGLTLFVVVYACTGPHRALTHSAGSVASVASISGANAVDAGARKK